MYHYTESGLDNVWLENGYKEKKTPYGMAVAIDDADGLHEVLALEIANKQGRMTGKELRFLRVLLILSQQGIAKMVGTTDQSMSLWERKGNVPISADALVRLLVLEKLTGDGKISEVIHRINVVERLVNQRIVATERKSKWRSKVESDEKESALA